MDKPAFLNPLVLSVDLRAAERNGPSDVYRPDGGAPAPAVVLVHGGPLPPAASRSGSSPAAPCSPPTGSGNRRPGCAASR